MPKRKPEAPSMPADPILETKVAPATVLPLNEITLSGRNPRKAFDPERMEELKASIRAHGVLEPIIVRPRGPGLYGYEIVAGERRYKAALDLQLDGIPAVVRELDDAEALECMLLENLQRQDLEPLEEARAVKEVLELTGIRQQDLGRQLGKSQSWVANRVRLANAPRELQELIPRGISPRHVFEVLPFQAYPDLFNEMLEALEGAIGQGYLPTLEELKGTVIEERILSCAWNGAATLDLDDLPRQYEDLKEYMDFHQCPRPECQEHIYVVGTDDGEHRFCLNKACFLEKLSKAKGTRQAEQQSKSSAYASEEDCGECDNWRGGRCIMGCTNDEECEDAYEERGEDNDLQEEDGEPAQGGDLRTTMERMQKEAPRYPVVDLDDVPDLPNGRNGYELFYMGMLHGEKGETKLEQYGCPLDCDKLRCREGHGNAVLVCLDPACYAKKEREIRAAEMRRRRDVGKQLQEELANARLGQLPGIPDRVLRDLLGTASGYHREAAQRALRAWGKVDKVSELAETIRKLPSHSLQDAVLRFAVCKELGYEPDLQKAKEAIAKLRDGHQADAPAPEPVAVEEGGDG